MGTCFPTLKVISRDTMSSTVLQLSTVLLLVSGETFSTDLDHSLNDVEATDKEPASPTPVPMATMTTITTTITKLTKACMIAKMKDLSLDHSHFPCWPLHS